MKRLALLVAVLVCAQLGYTQNYTTVSATKIGDIGPTGQPQPLASGSLCFLATDSNDRPISFQPGGGGQTLTNSICQAITNGALAGTLSVPNPANTVPAGVLYRIWVHEPRGDTLVYRKVAFTGTAFNFDAYQPVQSTTPITGQSVLGPLTVNGNLTITGSCTGCPAGGGGGSVTLQTNGVNNASQTTLNLQNGTGTTATNPSAGNAQVNVTYGTTSNTAAQGNDSRITGAVQSTRAVNTSSPITGGGTLSADLTIACPSCVTSLPALYNQQLENAGTNVTQRNLANFLNGLQAVDNSGSTRTDVSPVYGTGANTVAQGNDSRIVGALQAANNLSDVGLASTARTNLGLGTAATHAQADFSGVGACAASRWVSTINGNAAPTCTQPGFGDLTGSASSGQLPGTIVYSNQANTYTLGSKQTFGSSATTAGLNFAGVSANPSSLATGDLWGRTDLNHILFRDWAGTPATHTLFNSDDSLATSQLSGTISNAQLASSYSGVGTCATSNWVHGVNANAAPSCTQPAFSDISGSVASSQLPNPTTSAKGGVQAKDCTGTGHVLSINSDSTVTCSADSGGGGSGTTLQVGGASVNSTANLSNSTPAAAANTVNASFQKDASATTNISANVPVGAFDPINWVMYYDEFLGGDAGKSGGLSKVTAGSISFTDDPNGSVTFTTGSVSGNNAYWYASGDGSFRYFHLGQKTFDLKFRLKLSSTTSTSVWCGMEGGGSLYPDLNNVAFRYDTNASDTTWKALTDSTVTDLAVSPDTSFHTFRVRSTTAGTVLFSIDGGSETSIAYSVSTGLSPSCEVITRSAATRAFTIDYYWFVVQR